MSFVPVFKLYASDGVTPVYTFLAVQYTNAPQTVKKSSIIEGIRGNGCIVIPGSNASWDLIVSGILLEDNYTDLTTLINSMETSIVIFTNYVFSYHKNISETITYNVQRIEPIEYPQSFRVNDQPYTVRLKVNAW